MTVGEEIGGKLGLGAAGYLLGSRVNPVAAFLSMLVGAALGHYLIDERVMRTCPQCGLVFRVADELLSFGTV
jgi:hypothetical protein